MSIGPAAGCNFITIRPVMYGLGYDLALALGRNWEGYDSALALGSTGP